MALKLSVEEIRQDPYAVYSKLRNDERIVSVQMSGTATAYMITRYDDAVAVLKDARFSNEHRKVNPDKDLAKAWWTPRLLRIFMDTMVLVDDPAHARLRGLVHKAFTPTMIQKIAQRIEAISHELLDKAARKPVADLIEDFTLPLPLTVISEMMGVPPEERLKFRRWTTGLVEITSGGSLWNMVTGLPNALGMNRFFNRLITSRRKQPQDDLVTALVQANENGDTLSNDEMVAMLFLLLFAGHETTVNLIGNGMLALMQHPDQLQKLVAEPALMDSAIEEMLRFTNPVQSIAPRFALEDIELHGQIIPKGSQLLINIASANRDPLAFANADQFDITRNPNRHIAFGLGIHYCVGAPLARLEAKIGLTNLITRFPGIRLAVPAQELQWRNSTTLRGLKALPVHLQ